MAGDLEKYVDEIEPTGISFIDWVDSPGYDPKAIRAEFKAGWWGTLITDRLMKREEIERDADVFMRPPYRSPLEPGPQLIVRTSLLRDPVHAIPRGFE